MSWRPQGEPLSSGRRRYAWKRPHARPRAHTPGAAKKVCQASPARTGPVLGAASKACSAMVSASVLPPTVAPHRGNKRRLTNSSRIADSSSPNRFRQPRRLALLAQNGRLGSSNTPQKEVAEVARKEGFLQYLHLHILVPRLDRLAGHDNYWSGGIVGASQSAATKLT
jgi:hypothetical protein